MRAQIYGPAEDVAQQYLERLTAFGANPEMQYWAKQYALGHAGRCLWDARFLAAHYPSIKRLLNIGGAPYVFEMILRKNRPSCEVVALDLDPARFPLAEGTLNIQIVRGNVEDPRWKLDQTFECVVLAEVIEHFRIDLLGTLERIRRHLTPTGILYLTTPNGLSFWNIIMHLMRGRTGPSPTAEWSKLNELGHMGHVREYSLVELTELLTAARFKIEQVIFRGYRENRWPFRDLAISLLPKLAGEIVILAQSER